MTPLTTRCTVAEGPSVDAIWYSLPRCAVEIRWVPSGNPEKAVPESYASVTLAVTAGLPPLEAAPAVNTGLSPNTDAGRNDDAMEPPRRAGDLHDTYYATIILSNQP